MEHGRGESHEQPRWSRKVLELQCGDETILVDLRFIPAGFGVPSEFLLKEKRGDAGEYQITLQSPLDLHDDGTLKRWLQVKYGQHQILSELSE